MLLHTEQVKRLSIDIDIIYGKNIENFIKKIETIPGTFPFNRMEEDERGNRGLPNRRHFKFFYNSTVLNREAAVLLDVVLEQSSYLTLIEEKGINLFLI